MRKAKIILISAAVVLLLAALTVFCVFYFAFLSDDPELKPAKLSDSTLLSESETATGFTIAQKFIHRAKRSSSSDKHIIKISNKEMQHIMRLAENGESLIYLITGIKPRKRDGINDFYNISYDKGVYKFCVKLDEKIMDRYLVVSGDMKIYQTNGEPDIRFGSFKVGKIEMPDFIREKVKRKIYSYLKNDNTYDVVRVSVDKLEYLPNGDVNVHYYPYQLKKKIKRIF